MDASDLFEDIATIEAASLTQAQDDCAPESPDTVRWVGLLIHTAAA